jgi:hypothetical protein
MMIIIIRRDLEIFMAVFDVICQKDIGIAKMLRLHMGQLASKR